MKIVILGLSITSSWGNGHATTYRGLVRELVALGHEVLFLERDQPWYAQNRDLPCPPFGTTRLYNGLGDLRARFAAEVRNADCVIVGSYVAEGIAVGEWVIREACGMVAFYDIDTPVTLAKLATDSCEYVSRELIARYDLYLSFSGGPVLDTLQERYGSPDARALYCSADPNLYYPLSVADHQWALGYLGTFSEDRQPSLERLLVNPAEKLPTERMVVAGPQYPDSIHWPSNVERIAHLSPPDHCGFFNAQRFTLNISRAEMMRLGYSPSVRLFEAAACGCAIITDRWAGLEEFFKPGEEILVADTTDEVVHILRDLPAERAREIGQRARQRVLSHGTARHRAAELEAMISGASAKPHARARTGEPEPIAVL